MPEQHIDEILNRAKPDYLEKLYKVKDWRDSEHFLELIAFRSGKLLKVSKSITKIELKFFKI